MRRPPPENIIDVATDRRLTMPKRDSFTIDDDAMLCATFHAHADAAATPRDAERDAEKDADGDIAPPHRRGAV